MNEMHLFPELSSQEVDEVPADIFFAMMTESDEELVHDVEIECELVGETLVLHPPKEGSLPFTVQGNQITASSKMFLNLDVQGFNLW